MKDVIKRKTAINAKGFAGVYGCTDFVGAGHTSRIAAEKRKEKRRARRSVKQALHQGVYDFKSFSQAVLTGRLNCPVSTVFL